MLNFLDKIVIQKHQKNLMYFQVEIVYICLLKNEALKSESVNSPWTVKINIKTINNLIFIYCIIILFAFQDNIKHNILEFLKQSLQCRISIIRQDFQECFLTIFTIFRNILAYNFYFNVNISNGWNMSVKVNKW